MRIGISVLTHRGQSNWQNGLGQTVIFLADAFYTPAVRTIDSADRCGRPAVATGVGRYVKSREPCLIGMEACGGAQHWARRLKSRERFAPLTCPSNPFLSPFACAHRSTEGYMSLFLRHLGGKPLVLGPRPLRTQIRVATLAPA